jgi:hypothetical protein
MPRRTKRIKPSLKRLDAITIEAIGRSSAPVAKLAEIYNVSMSTVKRCRERHPAQRRGQYAKRLKTPVRCPGCGYEIATDKCLICAARRVGGHV